MSYKTRLDVLFDSDSNDSDQTKPSVLEETGSDLIAAIQCISHAASQIDMDVITREYNAALTTEECLAGEEMADPRSLLSKWRIAAAILLTLFLGGGLAVAGIVQVVHWLSEQEPPVTVLHGNTLVQTLEGNSSYVIGTDDVRATTFVADVLAQMGLHHGQFRIAVADDVQLPIETGDIICVGGPTVNRATTYYLNLLRGNGAQDERGVPRHGFRFVTPRGIPEQRYLRVSETGPWGIEDIESGALAPSDEKSGIDCALVVIGRDPARGTMITLISGYGGTATLRTTQAMATKNGPLFRKLWEIYRRTGYVEAVVAIEAGKPEEFYVFDILQNPRGLTDE